MFGGRLPDPLVGPFGHLPCRLPRCQGGTGASRGTRGRHPQRQLGRGSDRIGDGQGGCWYRRPRPRRGRGPGGRPGHPGVLCLRHPGQRAQGWADRGGYGRGGHVPVDQAGRPDPRRSGPGRVATANAPALARVPRQRGEKGRPTGILWPWPTPWPRISTCCSPCSPVRSPRTGSWSITWGRS